MVAIYANFSALVFFSGRSWDRFNSSVPHPPLYTAAIKCRKAPSAYFKSTPTSACQSATCWRTRRPLSTIEAEQNIAAQQGSIAHGPLAEAMKVPRSYCKDGLACKDSATLTVDCISFEGNFYCGACDLNFTWVMSGSTCRKGNDVLVDA